MRLKDLILEKLPTLSAGQKKVAEYILQNETTFIFATLSKISKDTSVSETTVIRLAYSLGFDSFSEMQKHAREDMMQKSDKYIPESNPQVSFYSAHFAKEVEYLQKWISSIDEEKLEHLVEILLSAEQILIVGARGSYPSAVWLSRRLNLLLGNVKAVQEFYDPDFTLLDALNKKTAVIAISFPRYAKWTQTYVNSAKKHAAAIISFVDKISAPLFSISDISIVAAPSRDELGFTSHICLYALFDAIFLRISKLNQKKIAVRLGDYERIYSDFEFFDD